MGLWPFCECASSARLATKKKQTKRHINKVHTKVRLHSLTHGSLTLSLKHNNNNNNNNEIAYGCVVGSNSVRLSGMSSTLACNARLVGYLLVCLAVAWLVVLSVALVLVQFLFVSFRNSSGLFISHAHSHCCFCLVGQFALLLLLLFLLLFWFINTLHCGRRPQRNNCNLM